MGKPDHHHLGGSLFPHIPPLQGLLLHIHTVHLLQYCIPLASEADPWIHIPQQRKGYNNKGLACKSHPQYTAKLNARYHLELMLQALPPMGLEEPPTTCGLPLFSMAKSSPLSVLVKLQHPEIAGFLLRTHKTLYRHQAHPFNEQIFAVFTAYPCDSVCFITSGAHCSKSAGASEVSSNHRTQPL